MRWWNDESSGMVAVVKTEGSDERSLFEAKTE